MPADDAYPKSLTTYNIVPCFVCGASFIYRDRQGERNGHICSMRCQNYFDAGGQIPTDPPFTLTGWRVVAGPPGVEIGSDYYATVFGRQPVLMKRSGSGFRIECPGCHREFDSLGLRCCSAACERRHRERHDNQALMEAVGMDRTVKRQCANPDCNATVPKWRKGRAVPLSVRYCSKSCADKLRRLTDRKAKAGKEPI